MTQGLVISMYSDGVTVSKKVTPMTYTHINTMEFKVTSRVGIRHIPQV